MRYKLSFEISNLSLEFFPCFQTSSRANMNHFDRSKHPSPRSHADIVIVSWLATLAHSTSPIRFGLVSLFLKNYSYRARSLALSLPIFLPIFYIFCNFFHTCSIMGFLTERLQIFLFFFHLFRLLPNASDACNRNCMENLLPRL